MLISSKHNNIISIGPGVVGLRRTESGPNENKTSIQFASVHDPMMACGEERVHVCGAPACMHVSASDCLPHFVRARSVTLGRIRWPVAISRKRKCAKRRTFGGNGSSWVLWCAAGIRSRRCIICIGSNPDKKKIQITPYFDIMLQSDSSSTHYGVDCQEMDVFVSFQEEKPRTEVVCYASTCHAASQ